MSLIPDYQLSQHSLEIIYLNNAFTQREITFDGDIVQVLNRKLPFNFENSLLYFGTDRLHTVAFDLTSGQLTGSKIFPLFGNASYRLRYEKIYVTLSTGLLDITNGGNWNLAYQAYRSTPLYLFLGKSREATAFPMEVGIFTQNLFSLVPTANAEANVVFRHGYNDKVKVWLGARSIVNTIRFRIYQQDVVGNLFLETDISPNSFPFGQTFELPSRYSPAAQVYVNGGGAGELGAVDISFTIE